MTFKEELESWKRLIDTAAFIWLRRRNKFSDIQLAMPGPKKDQIIEQNFYAVPKEINDLPGAPYFMSDAEFSQRFDLSSRYKKGRIEGW